MVQGNLYFNRLKDNLIKSNLTSTSVLVFPFNQIISSVDAISKAKKDIFLHRNIYNTNLRWHTNASIN